MSYCQRLIEVTQMDDQCSYELVFINNSPDCDLVVRIDEITSNVNAGLVDSNQTQGMAFTIAAGATARFILVVTGNPLDPDNPADPNDPPPPIRIPPDCPGSPGNHWTVVVAACWDNGTPPGDCSQCEYMTFGCS